MAKISLERVEFREPGINVPGKELDQYPSRETVLVSYEHPMNRLRSRQHYVLWHDGEYVYVQHPAAVDVRPPEKVPMSNVLQLRESRESREAKK